MLRQSFPEAFDDYVDYIYSAPERLRLAWGRLMRLRAKWKGCCVAGSRLARRLAQHTSIGLSPVLGKTRPEPCARCIRRDCGYKNRLMAQFAGICQKIEQSEFDLESTGLARRPQNQ